MPTDHPAPTTQIDGDGVPIALGFQAVADESTEADSNCLDCDSASLNGHELEQTQSLDNVAATESHEPLTGYKLVEDMMRRQDEVLMQLDDLNVRVESAIKEVSAARKSEIEAMEAEPEVDSGDSANSAGHAIEQRKAA